MGENQSKLDDYTNYKKCIDSKVLEKGRKFYIVTSHEQPNKPQFIFPTYSIRHIGYVCAWKLSTHSNLYIFELVLTNDIHVVELRKQSDITNLHSCTGIEFKLESGFWNNYHTLNALSNYDGWIEYPTAEPGRPMGIEIAIKDPSSLEFTGNNWTLDDILVKNADEFAYIDSELVTDLKLSNSIAIEFAKKLILDVTKLLNYSIID